MKTPKLFSVFFKCSCFLVVDGFALYSSDNHRRHYRSPSALSSSQVQRWNELEGEMGLHQTSEESFPRSIDSVLDPSNPTFSSLHPTLFRERHGWCPYSERVWLTMELVQMDYDTVRIDNTGGPRPSYYGGQTPQMKWPESERNQGESMDLVAEIDKRYGDGRYQSASADAQTIASKVRSIFPRARPSSRAAFLFQMNGDPLWRSTFEETLQKTNELLSASDGAFFCGPNLTIADIAWAPFLERYRYQLPCLHEGLNPTDPRVYPHIAQWYMAMDQSPEYICRVRGDASSWRKVLSMAGFGNGGVPPQIQNNMDNLLEKEELEARECIDIDLWKLYAQDRPYVQSTPYQEAAAIMTRNREAIVRDIVKQSSTAAWHDSDLPTTEEDADEGLRALVQMLLKGEGDILDVDSSTFLSVQSLATFLDQRMCVPRDMGAMTAATIKNLAVRMREAKTSGVIST